MDHMKLVYLSWIRSHFPPNKIVSPYRPIIMKFWLYFRKLIRDLLYKMEQMKESSNFTLQWVGCESIFFLVNLILILIKFVEIIWKELKLDLKGTYAYIRKVCQQKQTMGGPHQITEHYAMLVHQIRQFEYMLNYKLKIIVHREKQMIWFLIVAEN